MNGTVRQKVEAELQKEAARVSDTGSPVGVRLAQMLADEIDDLRREVKAQGPAGQRLRNLSGGY